LNRFNPLIDFVLACGYCSTMARLLDVAKAAGVSHGTASNVFNKPDLVRPALRGRVLAAAAALGYVGPDPRGRLLRDGKFNAVAVMAPSDWNIAESLRNPVFHQFLQGVGEACSEYGANLVIAPGNPAGPAAMADCVIFARPDQLKAMEAARLRRIPFTVVDYDPGPGIASVRADARAGAFAAAQHLIALGHRAFGILSFLREMGSARAYPAGTPRPPEAAGIATDQEKYAGYRDALAEVGLDIGHCPMVQAEVYDESAPGQLLDLAPQVTAILSMSVMQAVNTVREARRRGVSVPGGLSVVGYNDSPGAAACDPPLTTVGSCTRDKGLEAGRQVLDGGPPRQIVLAPRLILRATTAPPGR